MSFKHGLVGSADALFELFSTPMFLPHGAHFQPTRKQRRAARQRRLKNWQRGLRRTFATRALERYGLDELTPDGRPNPDNVAAMRRARKQERQAAR